MLGGIIQFGPGNYDGALLLKLLVGGLCGTLTASLIGGRIAQRPLRVGLLVMLMLLGFQLALHGYTFTREMHAALQTSSR